MGRTNSTYRNHLDSFIKNFKPFKKALRTEKKKYLNSIWEKAHEHAHAASYMNHSNPGLPAIISVMVGLQKETYENSERIEELEERIDNIEG